MRMKLVLPTAYIIRLCFGIGLACAFLVPQFALGQAAVTIVPATMSDQSKTYGPGTRIPIEVRIDTRGTMVGVAEGVLVVPDDLSIISVSAEGSFFHLWVQEPTVVGNTISFVGGVPAGFSGDGRIFSAVLEAKTTQTARVLFDTIRVLSFAAEPEDILRSVSDAWYPFEPPQRIPVGYEFETEYQDGDRSLDVGYLTLCLQREGLLAGDMPETFDAAVRTALEAFQVRVGLPATGQLDAATRDALNRTCQQYELPDRLFDINLMLDDAVITSITDLSARVIFTSFGQVPTEVDLFFSIQDANGVIVHTSQDSIVVETEYVFTKTFSELDLPPGTYTLVLETLYDEDVLDEFTALFKIEAPAERALPFVYVLLLALILIAIAWFQRKRQTWFN